MMKRLLMIAAMLLMAAIVLPPLARDQIQTWKYSRINDLMDETGHENIRRDASGGMGDAELMMGVYSDGEGYGIVTVHAPSWTESTVYENPMYPAATGDDRVRVWYGLCGLKEEPVLQIFVDEDEPRCRMITLDGADHRSLEHLQDLPVEFFATELTGLPDAENRLTVTLYTMDGSYWELDSHFNVRPEAAAPGVLEAAEEAEGKEEEYLTVEIDLTEALAAVNW